jgi:ribosomal protein S8E
MAPRQRPPDDPRRALRHRALRRRVLRHRASATARSATARSATAPQPLTAQSMCAPTLPRTTVCTRKSRISDVVYNASNNEYVRTKMITKGTIVLIDATPFRNWHEQFYGQSLAKKGGELAAVSARRQKVLDTRSKGHKVESRLADLMAGGRVLARISARPGQSGRADGYVLEGPELEFYKKKIDVKKSKK